MPGIAMDLGGGGGGGGALIRASTAKISPHI